MERHQLEAFSAVMSVGSITGAGRLLERSQPAVTRQIQELEADLGYTLFARNGPRVTPTHEAYLLYEEVERSLVGMEAIAQRARAIGSGAARPIALAATASLATSLLPDALRRVLLAAGETAPAAAAGSMPRWQVRTQSAEHVVHAVLTDHADIGLTTLPAAHDGLAVHWIAEAPCVLALPLDHRLALPARSRDDDGRAYVADQPGTASATASRDLPAVPLRALENVGLATVANRHRLRHRIDMAFAQARVTPSVWLETNNGANALMAARTGAMAAIVDPATAVGQHGHGVQIRALEERIPFLFALITRAGRTSSPSMQRLLQALYDSTRALLPELTFHPADAHDALLQQSRSGSSRAGRTTKTAAKP
ncbi:LysR family transcriptional regulator [Robbsia sp. KACC 23696]|uniref:LysR family transcriptional regulator n=1 Tax=Robbsia sp. KACC 23696 TaxID=3149231 RepID=UPI00325A61FD